MDFTKLTAYLDSLDERYGVKGLDIKITRDHETVYRHMAGHSDYAAHSPVSDKDLYNIYSGSKVITMVGIMKLIEDGKIGLYDELSRYFPQFASMRVATDFEPGKWPIVWPTQSSPTVSVQNPILIHDMMSMTAGFSYDTDAEPIRAAVQRTGGHGTTREIVAAMAKMPLLFEPGTRWSYALSHDILAAVAEEVTGTSFGEFMRKAVFEPLGMEDVFYQVPKSEEHRLSAQYACDFTTGAIKPDSSMIYRFTDRYESGGAGLTVTVDAYSKVIDALACGGVGANGTRILRPSSIETLSKNWLNDVQLQDFQKTGKDGYGYGLGVRTLLDASRSRSPAGEFGWDGAAGCYALVDPVNHISIFYVHEILGMLTAYSEIHPAIRDLAYEAMGF